MKKSRFKNVKRDFTSDIVVVQLTQIWNWLYFSSEPKASTRAMQCVRPSVEQALSKETSNNNNMTNNNQANSLYNAKNP